MRKQMKIHFLIIVALMIAFQLVKCLNPKDFCKPIDDKCPKPFEYKCTKNICSKSNQMCRSHVEINRYLNSISLMEPIFANKQMKAMNENYKTIFNLFFMRITNCTNQAYAWKAEDVN